MKRYKVIKSTIQPSGLIYSFDATSEYVIEVDSITSVHLISITDLHTPVRELTRLVSVYSVPWEQKSEQLKKLHTGRLD